MSWCGSFVAPLSGSTTRWRMAGAVLASGISRTELRLVSQTKGSPVFLCLRVGSQPDVRWRRERGSARASSLRRSRTCATSKRSIRSMRDGDSLHASPLSDAEADAHASAQAAARNALRPIAFASIRRMSLDLGTRTAVRARTSSFSTNHGRGRE